MVLRGSCSGERGREMPRIRESIKKYSIRHRALTNC